MQKTASLIFSVLFIIAFSSTVFPADQGNKANMFAGKVVAVDNVNKTITLKEDKKGSFTSTFSDKTRVFQNMQPKSVSDVKVGAIAAVVFEEVDGKNFAKTISIFGYPQ